MRRRSAETGCAGAVNRRRIHLDCAKVETNSQGFRPRQVRSKLGANGSGVMTAIIRCAAISLRCKMVPNHPNDGIQRGPCLPTSSDLGEDR